MHSRLILKRTLWNICVGAHALKHIPVYHIFPDDFKGFIRQFQTVSLFPPLNPSYEVQTVEIHTMYGSKTFQTNHYGLILQWNFIV